MRRKAPPNGTYLFDDIDLRIMNQLLHDARIKHLELADRVGLSATACARRIRQLETAGILRGYRADFDPNAFGLTTTVIVTITLERQNEETLTKFETAVGRCPNIISCHLMSGSEDYLLQVGATGIGDYEYIHKQYLSRLPGIARIQSNFAMREIVRKTIPEITLRAHRPNSSRK